MSEERTPCYACGAYTISEKHHIAPLEYGGIDSPDNILYLCRTCHDLVTTGFMHIGNMSLLSKLLVTPGDGATREAKLFSLVLAKTMACLVTRPQIAYKVSLKLMEDYLDSETGLIRNSLPRETIMNNELYGYRFKNRRLVANPSEKRVLDSLNKLRKLGVRSETILKALERLGRKEAEST